jgi:mycofactocin precursor
MQEFTPPTDQNTSDEQPFAGEESVMQLSEDDGDELEDDFEEELIIEDFTIDGICGVY